MLVTESVWIKGDSPVVDVILAIIVYRACIESGAAVIADEAIWCDEGSMCGCHMSINILLREN